MNIFHLFPFIAGIRKKTDSEIEMKYRGLSEEARRQSEERYRSILTSMEDGYFEVDLAGNMLFSNQANDRIFGFKQGEQIGMNYREYTDPENTKKVFEIFNKVYLTGVPHKGFEWVVNNRNGKKINVETSVSLMLDTQKQPIGFRGILRDITLQKQTEAALRQSEERYRNILDNIEEGYFETDLVGNMLFSNESHCRIYGFSPGGLLGLNYRQYIDQENAKKVYELFNKAYQSGSPEKFSDFELIRKDGVRIYVEGSVSLLLDSNQQKIGFRGVLRDVTHHKQTEESLKTLSLIDDLTGLYNRRGFLTLAEQEFKVAQRMARGIFLLFADVDDLKVINDSFGHLEGDRALIEIARILKENFRDPDIIARIGGDEFVILAIEGTSEAGPELLRERLQENLEKYNKTEPDRKYRLSLSMGAVGYDPENPVSIADLLFLADKSMYEEKLDKKKNTQLSLEF